MYQREYANLLHAKRRNPTRQLLNRITREHRDATATWTFTAHGLNGLTTHTVPARPTHSTHQELPAYAWPGGYTITYHTNDGSTLCAQCATQALHSNDPNDWPIAYGTYDEGPTIQCDDCNTDLESSYGDPDTDDHGIPFANDADHS